MKHCKNCDVQYDEDITVCKVCGKELEEGPSSLEEIKEDNEVQQEIINTNNQTNDEEAFQGEIIQENYPQEENLEKNYSVFSLIKGMFLKPFDTMKGVTEKLSSGTTWILFGIISVITSLFSAAIIKVVVNRFVYSLSSSGFGSGLYGMPYGLGNLADEIKNSTILKLWSLFFISLVYMIIFILLITLCIYIMCKIFRSKNTFMDIFKIVNLSSVYYIAGHLILFLLTLINASFVFIVATVAALVVIFFVSIALGLVNSLRTNKNNIIYIVTLGYALNIIINNYVLELIMGLLLRNAFMYGAI